MNLDLNKLLNSLHLGNLQNAVIAVVVLGVVILALTYIVPILTGLLGLIGVGVILFIVYRFLKERGIINF